MSILIKGLKLPPVGIRQCIVSFADNCLLITDVCGKTLFESEYVEIPTPHGRLIDCERATFPTAFRYNTNDYAEGWNACIKAVQTAPTVIEAEVSE